MSKKTINLDVKLHKELKILAVTLGKSIEELVEQAIKKLIKDNK